MPIPEPEITDVIQTILQDYDLGRDIDQTEPCRQPHREALVELIHRLLQILCPGCRQGQGGHNVRPKLAMSLLLEETIHHLNRQISVAFHGSSLWCHLPAEELAALSCSHTLNFFRQIPAIRALVQTDVDAAWEGDPAADSREEILFAYPGLLAIAVHRLAHALYLLEVPMIPRMMNEYAHSITGVDIHPGATIGDHFFMDHGTGIVIGETACIGSHVRIYQGVTLGALTTRGGQSLRGSKRHPTIGDHVTIYAGASILGGDTVIGAGSVVGSNAFIISSVEPNTTVQSKAQELCLRRRQESREY